MDYFRRKTLLYARRLACAGSNVTLSPSSDIALSSTLNTSGGVIEIGAHSLIETGAIIRAYGGHIRLGSCTSIGPYTCLYGGGNIFIGNNTRIGPQCSIIASNHNYQEPQNPIFLQGMSCKGIEICDDVWIGAGAVILDGVRIGTGAIIAAGAVVSRSVRDRDVVGGVPARLIRTR